MTPMSANLRARIIIKIQDLASRLGMMERRLREAAPNARPILEVGVNAIRRELSSLARRLR